MIGAVALQVLDVLLVEDDLFIDAIRKVDNFYYADGSAGKLRTRAAEVEEAPVGNSHPHRAEGQAAGHPVDHQCCPFPSR